MIAAVVGASGRVEDVTLLEGGARTDWEIAEGDQVIVWIVRAADLLGEDHLPLSRDRIRALRVRRTESPADPGVGACGRCLGRVASAPQIVYAGDSCPIPVFAEAAVRAAEDRPFEITPEIRDGIRIEWPQECACAVRRSLALESAQIVGRRAGEWPVEVAAQAADGSVGVFGARLARRIAADGTRLEGTIEVEGYLTGGAGALDGSFLLVSQSEQWLNRGTLVDSDFRSHGLGELPFAARRMKRVRGFDPIFVVGAANPGVAGLFACDVVTTAARADCRSLLQVPLPGKWLGDVASAGPRQIVAVGDEGAYAIGRHDPSTDRWNFVTGTVLRKTFTDPAAGVTRLGGELKSVGSVGSRLYACGAASGVGPGRLIWTSPVPQEGAPLSDLTWSAVTEYPSAVCGAFAEAAGRPDRLQVYFPDRATSLELGPDPAIWVELADQPYDLETVTPGWALGTTRWRSVHRRASRTTTTAFELVYGSTTAFTDAAPAVAARGRELYTFGSDPLVIDPEDGSVRSSPVERFAGNEEPLAARYDPATDTFLVIGLTSGQRWLRRLSPTGGSAAIDTGAVAEEPFAGLAPLVPGRFVLADTRALWILEGDRLSPLPIAWDDPVTPEQDLPPDITPDLRCQYPQYLAWGGVRLWAGLDGGGQGVALATGCQGALVRVGPGGAQSISMGRTVQHDPTGLGTRPPMITAVRAPCPDRFEITADGREDLRQHARLWTVSPRTEDGAPIVRDSPELRGLSGEPLGQPKAIFGATSNPLLLVSSVGRSLLVRTERHAVLPFGVLLRAFAENDRGEVLLSAQEGFLVLIRPEP